MMMRRRRGFARGFTAGLAGGLATAWWMNRQGDRRAQPLNNTPASAPNQGQASQPPVNDANDRKTS
jgi:hypothetical protein